MYKICILFLLLLSNLSFADIIFIGGTKHILTDFESPNSHSRVATVEVFGDDGQTLIFDLTAKVQGKGKIRSEVTCTHIGGSNDKTYQQCVLTDDPAINDFIFDVKISATCYRALSPESDGIFIGSDRDNRNQITSQPIFDPLKNVTLTIDEEMITGGNCELLQVVITSYLQEINDIELEVIITSPF